MKFPSKGGTTPGLGAKPRGGPKKLIIIIIKYF
jgi:hypothetical protein